MKKSFYSTAEALADFKAGKFVIVTDDENRENEGDLICAAEKITPEMVNFMITQARGLVCCPISAAIAQRLDLPLMVEKNTELHQTQFTISVDYKHGTTTGISAFDRTKTIRALVDSQTQSSDFARPGHIFPLIAAPGGLESRKGHTEATIAFCQFAGLKEVGAICEILLPDGAMARGDDLFEFARKHDLKIVSIAELLNSN